MKFANLDGLDNLSRKCTQPKRKKKKKNSKSKMNESHGSWKKKKKEKTAFFNRKRSDNSVTLRKNKKGKKSN